MNTTYQHFTLSRESAFVEAIDTVKRRESKRPATPHRDPVAVCAAIDARACFAKQWTDARGAPCPQAGECALSTLCKATWQESTFLQRELVPIAQLLRREPAAPPAVAPQPKRHARRGYQPTGRVVDNAVALLLTTLDNPYILPTGWAKQPGSIVQAHHDHGRILVSQTPSFTSVYYAGVMCMRFWVNAAKCAEVDVAGVLFNSLVSSLGRERLFPLPKGVKKKSKPLSWRVRLDFSDPHHVADVVHLADAITDHYLT